MTISGWVYMVAVGFNAAASVRVGNELGAGHPKSAAFAVIIVTSSSFIISVVCAIVVLALRNVIISYAFTEGNMVWHDRRDVYTNIDLIMGHISDCWKKEVENVKNRLDKWDDKKEPLLTEQIG
ncbi:hypothetical protein ACLB2K_033226 [Fragaria x ananassa]